MLKKLLFLKEARAGGEAGSSPAERQSSLATTPRILRFWLLLSLSVHLYSIYTFFLKSTLSRLACVFITSSGQLWHQFQPLQPLTSMDRFLTKTLAAVDTEHCVHQRTCLNITHYILIDKGSPHTLHTTYTHSWASKCFLLVTKKTLCLTMLTCSFTVLRTPF